MDEILGIVSQLPDEWQSLVTFVLSVWLLLTKINKRKDSEEKDMGTEVIKLLIEKINDTKEVVRVREALAASESAAALHSVDTLEKDDLSGLDLEKLDLAKVIAREVSVEGKEATKAHIDKLIAEVENGAENRETAGNVISKTGKIVKALVRHIA